PRSRRRGFGARSGPSPAGSPVARGWRDQAKRYGAPVAFLAAATIAVLLVRDGLRSDAEPASSSAPAATVTRTTVTAGPPRQPRFYRPPPGRPPSDVALRFHTARRPL